jgi:hypothetical protein
MNPGPSQAMNPGPSQASADAVDGSDIKFGTLSASFYIVKRFMGAFLANWKGIC